MRHGDKNRIDRSESVIRQRCWVYNLICVMNLFRVSQVFLNDLIYRFKNKLLTRIYNCNRNFVVP